MTDIDKVWDILISYNVATEEELKLVVCINGYNLQTLNDVLFARTGYRDINQFIESMEE